jgi:hypothetical protein
MSNHSHQQRQTATQNFMQALGQLESVLQAEAAAEPAVTKPAAAEPTAAAQPAETPTVDEAEMPTDLAAALEAAAADIEQYMNAHDA